MSSCRRLARVAAVSIALGLGAGAVVLGEPALHEPTQPLNVPARPIPATDSIPGVYYFARGNDAFSGIDVDRKRRNGIVVALVDSAPTHDREQLQEEILDRVSPGATVDFQRCPASLKVLEATNRALGHTLTTERVRKDGVVSTDLKLCGITITTTKSLSSPAAADLRNLFSQPFVTVVQGPGVILQSL